MQDYQAVLIDTLLSGDFFSTIGLSDIPVTEKSTILKTMSETVHARVFSDIYDLLSDEDRENLRVLAASELVSFLQEREIDLITMLIEAALLHRMEVIMVYQDALMPNLPMPSDPVSA